MHFKINSKCCCIFSAAEQDFLYTFSERHQIKLLRDDASCFQILGGRICDVSGLVDFDLSINKLYSKSGVDTKLGEAVITLEGRTTVQRVAVEMG